MPRERSSHSCLVRDAVLVYPVGVPLYFWYLLRRRYRRILEKQRDKEQLAVETNEAAKRVDRLQHKHAALNRRASVGRGLVKVLRETDLASFSSRQELDIGKEAWADGEGGGFGTVAVWRETSSVLNEQKADFLGFLLNPYLLNYYWQRRESRTSLLE